MKPELPASLWPLVHRAAAGEAWPPSSGAAADLLVAQAARQGLLPLLFEAHGEMPAVVQEALERQRGVTRVHAARTARLRDTAAGCAASSPTSRSSC
jgi:hypothetical protein